jgi:hypothetical protein
MVGSLGLKQRHPNYLNVKNVVKQKEFYNFTTQTALLYLLLWVLITKRKSVRGKILTVNNKTQTPARRWPNQVYPLIT